VTKQGFCRRTPGAVLVFFVALVAVAWAGMLPAHAHALAQSSDPSPGSTLATAPKTVTIIFGERPDPRLSSITVLDTSGAPHQQGRAAAVPDRTNALQVSVNQLPNGVYTVSWRTVSQVDGHLASGSFAFGVGVTPTGVAASAGVVRSPPASPWSVAARWMLYVGLMLLAGSGLIGLLGERPPRLRWVALAGWWVTLVGVAGLAQQGRDAAGLSVSQFWDSSLGTQTLVRGVPLLIGGLALAWLVRRPAGRAPFAAIACLAAVVIAADVDASHAAGTRSWEWLHVGSQWLHFAAAAVWIGGLAALIVVLPTLDGVRRSVLARRFSNVATASLALVALTGSQRALTEVRSWHGLFDTTFGRWVIVKIVLLVAIATFGLVNRTRGVPSIGRSPRLLRQAGSAELALAAVVLVAAGFLQSLAPPSSLGSRPKSAPPLSIAAADFATTVKIRLEVSPGTAGFNTFTLRASDFDTGRPVSDARVSLTFALPSRPDLGQSRLDLTPASSGKSAGTYSAQAANLSVDGTWNIAVLFQRQTGSVEIPVTLTTRRPPVKIDVSRSPGLPAVYTIHATSADNVQVYLEPVRAGLTEFHVTFIGSDGSEVAANKLTVSASRAGAASSPTTLTVRKLDNVGHFVADLEGPVRGRYQFSVDATLATGQPIHADIALPVS
jgi:copper transport protein